jgi:hypothetical protein
MHRSECEGSDLCRVQRLGADTPPIDSRLKQRLAIPRSSCLEVCNFAL